MTPFTDEDPVIRRTADGGWLSVRSEPPSGWAEEQPRADREAVVNPFNEKRNRDRGFLGAAHDIVFDDEVQQTATPNFNGGARPAASRGTPAPPTWPSYEPGG